MKNENIYRTINLTSGKILNIGYDTDPLNPRDDMDHFGTMVCFHKRYSLGDKHSYNLDNYDSWDELKKQIIEDEGDCIFLPLYLYDHSGITISTTSFSCRWDSGQVGFIYISKKKVREEYSVKRVTKKILDRVINHLTAEVKTYDDYLTGNVYYFELLDNDGNDLDSCHGFYNTNFKENGLIDYVELENEEREELINLI